MTVPTKHKLSDQQLSVRNRYKDFVERKIIFITESTTNACDHEAIEYEICSVLEDNKYYVFQFHDGEKFDNLETMKQALYPSISTGEHGIMGCGGLVSALLLVPRNDMFCHMIFSKTKDGGEFVVEASIKNGNCIQVEDVSEQWLRRVKTYLNSLYETTNVAYITRYEDPNSKNSAFQTFASLNDISAYVPQLMDRLNFHYTNGIILNKDKNNIVEAKKYDKGEGGKYVDHKPFSMKEFDDAFMHKCFKYEVKAVTYKMDEKEINFDATLHIKVYGGLAKQYSGGSKFLITKEGRIERGVTRFNSKLNTCCTLGFEQEKDRFSREPFYYGNHIVKTNNTLGLAVSTKAETFDDVNEFEEFEEILKKQEDDDQKAKLVRTPFVFYEYIINKVNYVSINGEKVNLSNPEIRGIFGGFDEFFRSFNPELCTRKILSNINNRVSSEYANELNEVRKLIKKLFPFDEEEFTPLTIYSEGGKRLYFLPNDESTKYINPGQEIDGKLFCDSSLTKLVSSNEEFQNKRDGYSLCYNKPKDVWKLTVCDLKKFDISSNTFINVTKDIWINTNAYDRLPKRNLIFVNNLIDYELDMRVQLPKSYEKPNAGGQQKGKNKEDVSNDCYKTLGHHSIYVYYCQEKNIVLLNIDNPYIRKIFSKNPEKKVHQDRLWEEINRSCKEIYQTLDPVITSNFKSDRIESDWYEGESMQYIINLAIRNVIINKSTIKTFQLNDEFMDEENMKLIA